MLKIWKNREQSFTVLLRFRFCFFCSETGRYRRLLCRIRLCFLLFCRGGITLYQRQGPFLTESPARPEEQEPQPEQMPRQMPRQALQRQEPLQEQLLQGQVQGPRQARPERELFQQAQPRPERQERRWLSKSLSEF